MKNYNTIGELFVDYREFYDLSQLDLADKVNVDLRTIQRWERDITLIKSEKEEEIVLKTLMPYQLIHNLNAAVPIPTFYNFKTRKYSLNERSNSMPEASWFKDQIEIRTNNLRKIDFDHDIKYIKSFIHSQKRDENYLNEELIKEAIRILPELNFVLTGDAGYYSGHCITLPLKKESYKKLRNREIITKDLRTSDLTNYKLLDKPIFFSDDTTADCNDTIFYTVAGLLRFFRDIENKKYLSAAFSVRDDEYELDHKAGIKIVWEDLELQKELGLKYPPRLMEGNYNEFLEELN